MSLKACASFLSWFSSTCVKEVSQWNFDCTHVNHAQAQSVRPNENTMATRWNSYKMCNKEWSSSFLQALLPTRPEAPSGQTQFAWYFSGTAEKLSSASVHLRTWRTSPASRSRGRRKEAMASMASRKKRGWGRGKQAIFRKKILAWTYSRTKWLRQR